MTVGPDGSATFVWVTGGGQRCGDILSAYQHGAGQPAIRLQVVASDASGTCPRRGGFSAWVEMSTNAAGDVALAWFGGPNGGAVHVALRHHSSDEWAVPEAIGAHPGVSDDDPAIAVVSNGDVLVTWNIGRSKIGDPAPGLWVRRHTAA